MTYIETRLRQALYVVVGLAAFPVGIELLLAARFRFGEGDWYCVWYAASVVCCWVLPVVGVCREKGADLTEKKWTPEPWTFGSIEPLEANEIRAIACVNACAGMDDPAAEIARLRAALSQSRPPAGHVMEEDGRVRKVLGTLPVTADGCVIGHGARIHGFYDDGTDGWQGFSSVRIDTDDWDMVPGGAYSSAIAVRLAAKKAAEAAGGEGEKAQ